MMSKTRTNSDQFTLLIVQHKNVNFCFLFYLKKVKVTILTYFNKL